MIGRFIKLSTFCKLFNTAFKYTCIYWKSPDQQNFGIDPENIQVSLVIEQNLCMPS